VAIVFKDLHKLVSHSQQENTTNQIFKTARQTFLGVGQTAAQARRHKNRWGLLFNHIIGLPQKDGNDKPLSCQ